MLLGSNTQSMSVSLRYALFALNVYVRDYDDYLDVGWFGSMLSNVDGIRIYGSKNDVDLDTALGALVHRWLHWSRRGAILRSDDVRYVAVPFIGCVKEYGYSAKLSLIISQCYSQLKDELPGFGVIYVS